MTTRPLFFFFFHSNAETGKPTQLDDPVCACDPGRRNARITCAVQIYCRRENPRRRVGPVRGTWRAPKASQRHARHCKGRPLGDVRFHTRAATPRTRVAPTAACDPGIGETPPTNFSKAKVFPPKGFPPSTPTFTPQLVHPRRGTALSRTFPPFSSVSPSAFAVRRLPRLQTYVCSMTGN